MEWNGIGMEWIQWMRLKLEPKLNRVRTRSRAHNKDIHFLQHL